MRLVNIGALSVAGLAVQATAMPVRVISFYSHSSSSDEHAVAEPVLPFRIGMAGAHMQNNAIENDGAEMPPYWSHGSLKALEDMLNMPEAPAMPAKKGGCRGSLSAKFNRFANRFRKVMGLPEIAPFHPPHHRLPPFVGMKSMRPQHVPVNGMEYATLHAPAADGSSTSPDENLVPAMPMPFHHRGGRHHRFHHHRGGRHGNRPFAHRVMHALYILGPIEGRIVAFVLGLGLGALIRVIYVLCVVASRAVRGRREREGRIILIEEVDIAQPLIEEKAPAYTEVASSGEETVTRAA